MLSHRGIIGNMTTYGENIIYYVSVTAAPRRKQYVVTVFYGFGKEFVSSRLRMYRLRPYNMYNGFMRVLVTKREA